ncbi:MAG: iron-containing alcohol dehydrogenase [Burkholderiaceae bacterium]
MPVAGKPVAGKPVAGIHLPGLAQTVIYGQPVEHVLADALAGARRVALVTNTSLVTGSDLPARIEAVLGERSVARISGVRAHSPRSDVVRVTAGLRDANVDAVIGLGGGSVCDLVKTARLCLVNDIASIEALDALRDPASIERPASLRFVMLPTTLSAGEFTPLAGITDERIPGKELFRHPSLPPDTVILDPALTRFTPARLWAGTGIRAVDHAIETWCSIDAGPYSDALSLHALRLLYPALLRCARAPADLQARGQCQSGAWLSIQGASRGVALGASHGIGHALGGVTGMPHGETSCVMLPHVLRHNAQADPSRQALLSAAMGRPDTSAGDLVAELVAQLGLPGRLRDAGVAREVLPQVAAEAIKDRWVATNPRPFASSDEILALLEVAW